MTLRSQPKMKCRDISLAISTQALQNRRLSSEVKGPDVRLAETVSVIT